MERFLSVSETGSERRSRTTTGSSEMRRRIPILIDSASSMASVEVVVRVSPRWAPPSVNVWKRCMPRATGEEMQKEEGKEKEKDTVARNGG